jgi:hypothetical protein
MSTAYCGLFFNKLKLVESLSTNLKEEGAYLEKKCDENVELYAKQQSSK